MASKDTRTGSPATVDAQESRGQTRSINPSNGSCPSHHAATASSVFEASGRATICSPSGRPRGPSPVGITAAGTPSSDQSVQNAGSPVVSMVGASPAAGGVTIASYSSPKNATIASISARRAASASA